MGPKGKTTEPNTAGLSLHKRRKRSFTKNREWKYLDHGI